MLQEEHFDVIIVGAGSAGCVLANHLSAIPGIHVALLEAGPRDTSPLISIPRGFGRLVKDRSLTWEYTTIPLSSGNGRVEHWVRGRVLGGSSAVNGMIYVRGQPADYDDWAAMGLYQWGWQTVKQYFQALEDHELGATDLRGVGGPVSVSLGQAGKFQARIIATGAALGLPVRDDLNGLDQSGIGMLPRTIRGGRRISSAHAFLHPVTRRRNLHVMTDTLVDKIMFHDGKATGVSVLTKNGANYIRGAEVILCAGALESPAILQRSGIGDANHLESLGIPVVADRKEVGKNLREHCVFSLQFRLNQWSSSNREFGGWRLVRNLMAYALTRRGVLAKGAYDVGAFFRTNENLAYSDALLGFTDFSFAGGDRSSGRKITFEDEPGMGILGYPSRPYSLGSVRISASDPRAELEIDPGYLSDERDQRASIAIFRFMRRFAETEPLASIISHETAPGLEVITDEEIISYIGEFGSSGLHASGTCAMGVDNNSVLDERCCVRGVSGVRVVDASMMPTLVSGNTNGPVMALALRAADLLIEDWRAGEFATPQFAVL